jgi:hypothetical protein
MSVLITGSGVSFGSGLGKIGAFAAGSAGCGACPLNITPRETLHKFCIRSLID